VDLRAQAQHFYALGARILDLFEEDEILDVLGETFRERAAEIGDHAKNAGGRGGAAGGGGGGGGGQREWSFLGVWMSGRGGCLGLLMIVRGQ
jgi:hypothetical protein